MFFVNTLTIKHCDRTKVKTITVKNSKTGFKNCEKTLESDDVSTLLNVIFSSQNKKKLFAYKYIRNKSLEIKVNARKYLHEVSRKQFSTNGVLLGI